MNRYSRPSRGTVLQIAVALAGVAVTGWAIADTAGLMQLSKSELPSGIVLAAGPAPSDSPSPFLPPAHADRVEANGAAVPGRPPHPPGPPGLPGPARLAALLAAAETYVGVRTDQMDAWRTFTDAAIALVPEPPTGRPPAQAEPFARSSEVANRLISEGKKAETLLAAIQQLKAKLTPDQLQRVAQFEAQIPPPPRGPGAPPVPN